MLLQSLIGQVGITGNRLLKGHNCGLERLASLQLNSAIRGVPGERQSSFLHDGFGVRACPDLGSGELLCRQTYENGAAIPDALDQGNSAVGNGEGE